MTVLEQIGESFGGTVRALTERGGIDWEEAADEVSNAVGEVHELAAENRVPVTDIPGATAMMSLLRGLQTKDPRVTYEAVREVKAAKSAMVKYFDPEGDSDPSDYAEFDEMLDGIEAFAARSIMARRSEITGPKASMSAFRKLGLDILDGWGDAPERTRVELLDQWDNYYRQADVRSGLTWLEDEGYVKAIKRPEGTRGPVAYKITPKGTRRLERKQRKPAVGESLGQTRRDMVNDFSQWFASRPAGTYIHLDDVANASGRFARWRGLDTRDNDEFWGEVDAALKFLAQAGEITIENNGEWFVVNDPSTKKDGWDAYRRYGRVARKEIPAVGESGEPSFRDLVNEQVVKIKGGLGQARDKLPQIPGEKLKEFITWLAKKGVKASQAKIPVKQLKPSQGELESNKIDSMAAKPDELRTGDPIITSKDDFVLDGHHRWGAFRKTLPDESIPALKVDLPIKDLIKLANGWDGAENRTVKESFRAMLAQRLGEDFVDDYRINKRFSASTEGEHHALLGYLVGQIAKAARTGDRADEKVAEQLSDMLDRGDVAGMAEQAEAAAAAADYARSPITSLLDRLAKVARRARGMRQAANIARPAGVSAARAKAELAPELYRAAAQSLADDLEGAIWVNERRAPVYAHRPSDGDDHSDGKGWDGAWVPVWISTRWLKALENEEGSGDSTWDWARDYGFDLRTSQGAQRKTYRNNFGIPFTMVRGTLFVPNESAEQHTVQRRDESVTEAVTETYLVSRTQLVDHHNSASRGPNGRVAIFESRPGSMSPPVQVGHTDGPIVEGKTTVGGVPYHTAVIRSPHWGALHPGEVRPVR